MGLLVDIQKKLNGFMLNVNFNSDGDATGLLGASGSGKSMTLRCIAGIETPDKGKIVLNDRVLFDSEKDINIPSRQRKVGFLFQNYALFPNMTVEENISFAIEKLPKEKRNIIVNEKIKMMKLDGLEKRYPFQLSGGQQQRVALARALAIEPEILLLDEPFSALDEHLRNLLSKQLIDTLNNYEGIALFVTHNMEEAYRICNELVVLENGNVEARGHKKEIFNKPPTITSAKLTGCKNFSAANYISSNIAKAWGVNLTFEETLKKDVTHVGIRAHYIKLATNDDIVNVFEAWPNTISEAPFKVTVYLSLGHQSIDIDDYQLQWIISKEEWDEIKDKPYPWKICLDPKKLLIFS